MEKYKKYQFKQVSPAAIKDRRLTRFIKLFGFGDNHLFSKLELKKAYRSQISIYHPDKHKDNKKQYEETAKAIIFGYNYVLENYQFRKL
jgi:hypothetical protein